MSLGNTDQLQNARMRRPDGKKGKQILRFTREVFPYMFRNGTWRIENGCPPDATLISLIYNQQTDTYDALVESASFPIVAEGCQIPPIVPSYHEVREE